MITHLNSGVTCHNDPAIPFCSSHSALCLSSTQRKLEWSRTRTEYSLIAEDGSSIVAVFMLLAKLSLLNHELQHSAVESSMCV